ncbi:GntR family transcriptional regulator [Gluconacetobacter azotocaptans]|uniref:GntR family transcriptional regulator n=1 Tax=Gluconacetobacter azotocaptans TaxID=142834 RepID=UPI001957F5A1|nr:GntR family transcriptional regulator [Gluconacetobacter azotocaptans]MBM9401620.1 GntR family transcriptional regulator [Gluconacetobacter azotocaptans]
MSESSVERAYDSLRRMAVGFAFKPGERLNEGTVSRALGMSRAPVREAMNRLASEGLLTVVPGQGFFCRQLSISEIEALYEVRGDLEAASVRAAARQGDARALSDLRAAAASLVAAADGLDIDTLIARDEAFHRELARLAGNVERVRILENANARIRFVRQINLERPARTLRSLTDHVAIADAVARGDGEEAAALMLAHLRDSAAQAGAGVRDGLARIYARAVA